MPDRRVDLWSRQRIAALEARYQRVAYRLTLCVGIIGATLVAVSIVLVILVNANADRAREARGLVMRINSERARNIGDNCRSSNERHEDAMAVLNGIFRDALKRVPLQAVKQLKAQKQYNVTLIDALAPKQDCAAVVASQVGR